MKKPYIIPESEVIDFVVEPFLANSITGEGNHSIIDDDEASGEESF